MREIKFRGFDIIGKKIVYGDLVHNQKVTKDGLEPRTMVGGYEVDPTSVCQYTGKKDRNGVEIYEGDKVKVYASEKFSFDANIVWHKGFASFLLDEGMGCFSPIPENITEVISDSPVVKTT